MGGDSVFAYTRYSFLSLDSHGKLSRFNIAIHVISICTRIGDDGKPIEMVVRASHHKLGLRRNRTEILHESFEQPETHTFPFNGNGGEVGGADRRLLNLKLGKLPFHVQLSDRQLPTTFRTFVHDFGGHETGRFSTYLAIPG
jgi:hypothetical protein